jgi:hypothetical protein
MTYDWESEDSLGSACGSVGIGGRFRCTGSRRDLAWSRRVKLLFDTHAFIWWGRRAVGAIWNGSGRGASRGYEQPTFEPRQRLGIANKDAARQACSPASACRRAS